MSTKEIVIVATALILFNPGHINAQPSATELFPCDQTDTQVSPPGAGIEKITMLRQNGSVNFMKIAYNRGSGWFDDSLDAVVPPDNFSGEFPINSKSKFAGDPTGKTFQVRVYGYYDDNGKSSAFRFSKVCTAKMTRMMYRNAYDPSPNLIIDITWSKEYP